MKASDLRTIALLEGGDGLVLWKYAIVSEEFHRRTHVQAFSQLDEFYVYRKHRYSYYISDGKQPDYLAIEPGCGVELRNEVVRKIGLHGARTFDGLHFAEVMALHGSTAFPVYVERKADWDRVAILLESLSFPLWVVGPKYARRKDRKYHPLYAQFADAIVYWVWQFTPDIHPLLVQISQPDPILIISIELQKSPDWFRSRQAPDSQPPVRASCSQQQLSMKITFRPGVMKAMARADNVGEREMMRAILLEMRNLLPVGAQAALSAEAIEGILNSRAPIGMKKMILPIDTSISPELDPRGLPPFRKIQQADEGQVLDGLGSYLRSHGLQEGLIPDARRSEVLNQAVYWLFGELQRLVSPLNPRGLMEWLLGQNEAITREHYYHRLTIPTRIACFGSVEEMTKDLSNEIPERTSAAVASRFLIEYAATCPPSGLRPISLDVYDQLLALCHTIFNFGFESDLLYFRLTDIRLSILPSGRLGADREQFESARNSFLPIFALGEISRATIAFSAHWKERVDRNAPPPRVEEIDRATAAEFGLSLTEIVKFLGEAANLGWKINPVVARLTLPQFKVRLTKQLAWPPDKVERAIGTLSLMPRADFLDPPAPHKRNDVYPWRYGRSLSYPRRPFIIRNSGDSIEILWGPRHVWAAISHYINTIAVGRIEAASPEMKQVISVLNAESSLSFNDQVAEFFNDTRRFIVRKRMKRLGSLRGSMAPPGDIDVFVVDRHRRRLLFIECKDLSAARTPAEMANEIENLFVGRGGKKSLIDRHVARVEWGRKHASRIVEEMGLETDGHWEVEGLVVVSSELFSPHLHKSPLPVVPFSQLWSAIG